MKRYQVKITGKALADMEPIYDYIASNLQSPGGFSASWEEKQHPRS